MGTMLVKQMTPTTDQSWGLQKVLSSGESLARHWDCAKVETMVPQMDLTRVRLLPLLMIPRLALGRVQMRGYAKVLDLA